MSTRFAPPRPVLLLALALTGPLLALCVLGYVVAGGPAVLGLVLGFTAGVLPAVAPVGTRTRAVAAALTAGAGVSGLLAGGAPIVTAGLVALAALAAGPLNRRAAGSGTMLPVLVAVTASVELDTGPTGLALWLLTGFGLVTLLARLLRVEAPLPGVPQRTARRHALATAVTAGLACWVVLEADVGHGYWLVLAAATILRPVPGESARLARDRVMGTTLGVGGGVVGVLVLPPTLTLALALLLLVLLVAWALVQEQRLQAAASSALVLLTSSGGFTGDTVGLALDRLLLTLGGATAAVLAAWLLHRGEVSQSHDEHP